MSMQREIAHRLLDELLELRGSMQGSQLAEARRHFLLAKREFLLGALALVDHALQQGKAASEGDQPSGVKTILVED